MTPSRTTIALKDGVSVELLLTPALYGIAKRKGIDLTAQLSGGTADSVFRGYALMAYCAAINAWEVRQVDDPTLGEFPYAFADFDAWSWSDRDELMRVADLFMIAFTGRSLKDYMKEAESGALKKKMKT